MPLQNPQDVAAHAAIPGAHHVLTRESYVPVSEFIVGGSTYSQTWAGILINAVGEGALLQMLVPQDFTAITALEVIFKLGATGASMHFKFTTKYGAYNGGEAANVHGSVGDNRDIGATVTDEHNAHDITDLAADLASGDRLWVLVEFNATVIASDAYIVGLRLKYS